MLPRTVGGSNYTPTAMFVFTQTVCNPFSIFPPSLLEILTPKKIQFFIHVEKEKGIKTNKTLINLVDCNLKKIRTHHCPT